MDLPNLILLQKSEHDDTLKAILAELGGVPHLDNEELKEARDTAITLELTNRFAYVHGQPSDFLHVFPLQFNRQCRSSGRREDPVGSGKARSSGNSSRTARTGFIRIAHATSN